MYQSVWAKSREPQAGGPTCNRRGDGFMPWPYPHELGSPLYLVLIRNPQTHKIKNALADWRTLMGVTNPANAEKALLFCAARQVNYPFPGVHPGRIILANPFCLVFFSRYIAMSASRIVPASTDARYVVALPMEQRTGRPCSET